MNNTRRTGIVLLLVGTLAVGLSSAAPRPAPSRPPVVQNASPGIADLEALLKRHRDEEASLQAHVRDLEKKQGDLLTQIEAQRELLENVIQIMGNPPVTNHQPPPVTDPPQSDAWANWMAGAAAVFAFFLCAIFLVRTRQAKLAPQTPDVTVVKAEAPVQPVESRPFFAPALPDWDSASPALDVQATGDFEPTEPVRTHESTMELAEIMLSFGRVNSAAEALADFIENNPKDAFAPWLKLLEVYRSSGQRAEFDKIAQKLNQTFNVWMVDWDNFNCARDPLCGLDAMPHVVERLQEQWGTRECQAYLQYLLHDTRRKTRGGFPLAAVEDVLCLSDILESVLGPYTGPIDMFDQDGEGSLTEMAKISLEGFVESEKTLPPVEEILQAPPERTEPEAGQDAPSPQEASQAPDGPEPEAGRDTPQQLEVVEGAIEFSPQGERRRTLVELEPLGKDEQ